MKDKILIVEDEFIIANDLKLMLIRAGYEVCGIAATVAEAREMISEQHPVWVMLDIVLQDGSLGTDLGQELMQAGIGFIYLSASNNQSLLEKAKETHPYGFLMKPFREKDILMMLDIACEKHSQHLRLLQHRQTMLRQQLLQLANSATEAEAKLATLPQTLQGYVPFDFIRIVLLNRRNGVTAEYGFFRTSLNEYQVAKDQELLAEAGVPSGHAARYKVKRLFTEQSGFQNCYQFRKGLLDDIWEKQLSTRFQLQSKLFLDVAYGQDNIAGITFYSQAGDAYTNVQLHLIREVKQELASIFEPRNAVSPNPPSSSSDETDDHPTATVIASEKGFEGIIGTSSSLLKVLDNVMIVAAAPVSVLILGESGTGKELVAKAIHRRSARQHKPMVVVNCAALPAALIESELFGYEKGAFTGAFERRAGKFESADGGTIFLDEIGELSLEAQVKLLRVLQEHEFERVGSGKTIKVDVRVIAATNRNLEKEVAEGRLRMDLYYRLNVFPITLPPLRERKTDILKLAQYFIEKHSAKMGRNQIFLGETASAKLLQHDWPGNIRELEHLIERSMLMTTGNVIEDITIPSAAGPYTKETTPLLFEEPLKTLEQMEYDYISEVLRKCNGRINGAGGAAEILGLPPSTLNSKLKKFGIKRDFFY